MIEALCKTLVASFASVVRADNRERKEIVLLQANTLLDKLLGVMASNCVRENVVRGLRSSASPSGLDVSVVAHLLPPLQMPC